MSVHFTPLERFNGLETHREDVARGELRIERLRKKFIDLFLNYTFCNKSGIVLCKMNKIKTLYMTASTEIKPSILNETFVVISPMPQV